MAKGQVYVLNSGYQLRNDVHRVVLFAKVGSGSSCSKDWKLIMSELVKLSPSLFRLKCLLQINAYLI